jgi:exonuclease V gamma subunit
MNNTERELLKNLAEENGLTADHFFKSPQGFVIITRQGIERIQQHRGIRVRV